MGGAGAVHGGGAGAVHGTDEWFLSLQMQLSDMERTASLGIPEHLELGLVTKKKFSKKSPNGAQILIPKAIPILFNFRREFKSQIEHSWGI